jgi:hypothetical protein
MPWARWWRYRRAGIDAEADAARQRWIDQAFGAWLQGAGDRMTFPQLLEHLGLRTPRRRKRSVKATLDDAARIREGDRRSRREH